MTVVPSGLSLSLDLRRIGDPSRYWYPLAWSDELKPGKTLARRFAGDPIVAVSRQERAGLRAGGPLRPPPGAACIWAWSKARR